MIRSTVPFCGAFAHQTWMQHQNDPDVWVAQCRRCSKFSVWALEALVFPRTSVAPAPNADLSEDVGRDYQEAADILEVSPRGSAALLRVALQKMCRELGESGDNLNDDIARLVKRGLPARAQQALDVVRVVGNNAVHPGQIDLRDDRDTALALFGLVNLVADVMITQPRDIEQLYGSLPQSTRDAIERRDDTT